jgi:error-prone DNA polymerase
MGFYSPHTLVQDARRHGVVVRTPDINASAAGAVLEPCAESDGGQAVRLGIGSVRTIGDDLAERIAAGRPYRDMEDVERRAEVPLDALEALATAGAFECFGSERRQALWSSGAVAQSRPERLMGIITGAVSPGLPGMDDRETAVADLWATGVAPDGHPTRFVRDVLDERGVTTAEGLRSTPHDTRVSVAGVVTHRQRPATAGGTTFINLEDETGLINVVCSKGFWIRNAITARTAPALIVRGRLERIGEVINVIAEKIEPLPLDTKLKARDFR